MTEDDDRSNNVIKIMKSHVDTTAVTGIKWHEDGTGLIAASSSGVVKFIPTPDVHASLSASRK